MMTRKRHKVTLIVPTFDPSYANATYHHPPAVLTSMVEMLKVPLESTSDSMTIIYTLYMFYVFSCLSYSSSHPIPITQLYLFSRFYIVFIRMGGDPTEGAYMVTKAADQTVEIKYGCQCRKRTVMCLQMLYGRLSTQGVEDKRKRNKGKKPTSQLRGVHLAHGHGRNNHVVLH